jgi:peroxin-19
MLDEFSSVKMDSKKPAASATGPGRPPTGAAPAVKDTSATAEDDVLSDDDFAKQLQAGMAELMGEMENSV